MQNKKLNGTRLRFGLLAGVLGVVALVGIACSGGGASEADLKALETRVDTLNTQITTLNTSVAGLQALAAMLVPGTTPPVTTPTTPAGDIVHGTFDTSNIINDNIRNGNTEFGIDQQPFLQGYSAVTALYTNWLFNVKPVASQSLTGPGFITTANIDQIPADVQGYRDARTNNTDLTFGIVHHGASTNPWWGTMNDTIRLAARNLGVEVNLLLPQVDEAAAEVRNNLVSAAARQFNGVATTISAENFGPPIEALLAQGIPVVAFNAGNGPEADGIPYRTYIGQTEYAAGYQGGQALAREVTSSNLSNPLAICFNQTVGLANLDARCRGFTDAMNEANISLGGDGVLNVGTDEVAATTNMSEFFTTNPNVNIFFTLGPQVAASFYDFIDDVGLDSDNFLHATFDNNTEIRDNITNGTTLFRIDQQQPLQGYGSVVALALEAYYGIIPASGVTLTGPGLVTAEEQASGAVPTRWFLNEESDSSQNTIAVADVASRAADVNFIAIQHAECIYDPFWCIVQEGVTQAAADTGVSVAIRTPTATEDPSDALPRLVNAAVAERPDGILLTYTYPNDSSFVAAVDAAKAAGIPVVAYNAGSGRLADGDRYLTVYNQDEKEAGRQAAQRLIKAAKDANISPVGVCVNHQVGNASTDARCEGFVGVFESTSGANVIGDGILATSDDATASVETLNNYFAANPTVNAFLTLGPNSAHPFYTFADGKGLLDS